MAQLSTVPNFTFYQGVIGQDDYELPVEVFYFDGTICLEQENEYERNSINIHPEYAKKLFKEIMKHYPDAEHWLKKAK